MDYLITPFLQENGGTFQIVDSSKGWTHGKFYERQFWIKNQIHYQPVQYCEDISISSLVSCIMMELEMEPNEFNETVYVWYRHSDSLCTEEYVRMGMADYVLATLNVIIKYVEKWKHDEHFFGIFNIFFLTTLFHVYFYF